MLRGLLIGVLMGVGYFSPPCSCCFELVPIRFIVHSPPKVASIHGHATKLAAGSELGSRMGWDTWGGGGG
jgi:hypothetical protein